MTANPQLFDGLLKPGEEWTSTSNSWRLISVSSGEAYWLSATANRFIVHGELLLAPPACAATVRASQIGDVAFHRLEFDPDDLLGFFTLDERHFLENAAATLGGLRFISADQAEAQRFNQLVRSRAQFTSVRLRVELLDLFLGILQEISPYRARSFAQATTATERFQELVTRISDAEFLQYSPKELSLLCRCGHRHLDRLFRLHFGASAREMKSKLSQLKDRQAGR